MSEPLRGAIGEALGRVTLRLLRVVRPGGGSTLPGRLVLAVDPHALRRMTRGRRVALVSATNGKTTTTHLLASVMSTRGTVATNTEGANLMPGLVTAMLHAPRSARMAVLETDERVLPAAVTACAPAAVVLLNLSRDQLDRHHEVAATANTWRRALAELPADSVVIADPGDPNIAWAASSAPHVRWVATGTTWRHDSALCPRCGGLLAIPERRSDSPSAVVGSPEFAATPAEETSGPAWHCPECDLHEPEADFRVDGTSLVTPTDATPDGRVALDLKLPGRFNVGNAALAATAAYTLGVPLPEAATALANVEAPQDRFRSYPLPHGRARLVLAKNPAGWHAALDLVSAPTVVLAIDTTAADGRDPSWLWDVPYERLAGRTVFATGPRAADMAVRMRYADVPTTLRHDTDAVLAEVTGDVDILATYGPFQRLRRHLAGLPAEPAPAAPDSPASTAA